MQAGLLSREIIGSGADTVVVRGRRHRWRRYRESSGDPARSENQGVCGIFMRENREVPCLARRG